MPEVIRRQREGVTGGARLNIRVSEAAMVAIRAKAQSEGFENPVHWGRAVLMKAAGYEAPVEETQRPPWEVVEGEEPASAVELAGDVTGEAAAPVAVEPPPAFTTKAKRGKSKKTRRAAPAVEKGEVSRATPRAPASEPSLLQLAKGALRRLLA